MNKDDLFTILTEKTGVIRKTKRGYKCTVCGKTANDPYSISHTATCKLDQCLDTLMSVVPKDFIPAVEKVIPFGLMVPFYASMSEKDLERSEQLVNSMFKAATREDRVKAASDVMQWSPSVSEDVLSVIMRNGLETNQDRILFRHYIIFKRATLDTLLKLDAELDDIVKQDKELSNMFNDLFDVHESDEVSDEAVLHEGLKTFTRMMSPGKSPR